MAIGIVEKEGFVKVTPEYLLEIMKPPFCSNDEIVMEPVEKVEKEPINFPNLRFQCCWARYEVNKLSEKNLSKELSLFGYIAVSDCNVSQEDDGWLPVDEPHHGYTLVFDREWHNPLPVKNNHFIPGIINPGTNRSVSVGSSKFLNIMVEVFAFDKEENECFKLAASNVSFNLSEPDTFITNVFREKDGHVSLSFIMLTDAVDAHLELAFKRTQPDSFVCGEPIHVKIIAYYGDDFVSAPDRIVKKTRGGRIPNTRVENGHYCLTLFESDSATLCDGKTLDLITSMLAVPAKGSLIVEAYIVDPSSYVLLMDGDFKIPAKKQGSDFGCVEGKGCNLEVNVVWKPTDI